jgi:hypothetical protein
VFIPCLLDPVPVFRNDPPYGIQLFGCETLIPCQGHGLKPEFTQHPIPLNMYVHSLITVEAVKEEPVWPWNITDRWHINYPNEL